MKVLIIFAITYGFIWSINSATAAPTQKPACDTISNCYQHIDPHIAAIDTKTLPKYAGYGRRYVNSVFPKQIAGSNRRTFVFSPRYKIWAAYDKSGRRMAHGIANGGAHYCADVGRPCRTPRGNFAVHSKGSFACKSSKYPLPRGGAPMPYCMHFNKGYAIHGSPQISNRNGSHGCIRVTTSAAQWLSSNFMRIGTRVKVLPY